MKEKVMKIKSFFFKTCPKSGRIVGINRKNVLLKVFFPMLAVASIIWYVIRVLPKPSRAEYPCQKAGATIIASFITYVLGATAWIKLTKKLGFARAIIVSGLVVGFMAYGLVGGGFINSVSAAYIPPDPPNTPIGVAKGVNPGRVVWVYNPDSTSWDGTTGYWWEDNNSSISVISAMLDNCVDKLTSTTTVAAAWDTLFKYYNQNHGKGAVGYSQTETIAIKINCNNTRDSHAMAVKNINPSPQLVVALLRELVNNAGVPQANIFVYDATRYITDNVYSRIKAEFPNVNVVDGYGGDGRIQRVYTSGNVVYYSKTSGFGKRVPTILHNAAYLINMPLMKKHVIAGITLGQKNHAGTVDGIDHGQIACKDQGFGIYSPFVDIMGSPEVGGKTVLTILDALYAPDGGDGYPMKYTMAPFNNDWASSIFASQDPVAIDSVGFDFLNAQFSDVYSNSDSYLHEAAQADNPPSGTFYTNFLTGGRQVSLGVHEHWNNPIDKKYSRNLGTGNGIELVVVSNGMVITVPVAPSGLSAGTITTTMVALHWTDNALNEDKYNVYVSTSATKPASPSIVISANSTNYMVNGLTANTLYYFWVDAENSAGKSAAVNISATTAVTDPKPAAPDTLVSTAQTPTSIALSWRDKSDIETSYRVYVNTVNTKPASPSLTLLSNSTTAVLTGLNSDTLYYFWVVAVGNAGESDSATLSVRTMVPPPPEYLTPIINAAASTAITAASLSFDGNTTTRWESVQQADPQWIYWDLGSPKSVSRIILDWETASAATYTINGSLDAATWTTLAAVTNSVSANHTLITNVISGNFRYIQMYGTTRTSGYGYSIYEAYIYNYSNNNSSTVSSVASSSSSSVISSSVISSVISSSVSSASSTSGETKLTITAATALTSIGGNTAAMSFDNNTGTRWESAQAADPQWIYWDLGSSKQLSKIILDWETASAANYTIQGSADAAIWTTLATVVNSSSANHLQITNALSGSYRYVKMNGTSRTTVWGYSIWEASIYTGSPVSSSSSSLSSSSISSVVSSSSSISSTSSSSASAGSIKVEAQTYTAMNGIVLEACSEGGQDAGYIDGGDWMDFSVNIAVAGTYAVVFRTASPYTGTSLDLREGTTVLASGINLNTGGFQTWGDVAGSKTFSLTAGTHTLRINAVSNGFNFHYFTLTKQ